MPHGRWDLAKRAAAQQLDQMEPAWSVWYGVGTRRFYAVATWASSEPLLVLAPTPEELRDLMRDVERIRAKAGHLMYPYETPRTRRWASISHIRPSRTA